MKSHRIVLIAWTVALLAQGAGAAAVSAPNQTAADSKPAAVSPANPELGLKQGMGADVVRQIMGMPDRITPMKAPNGKAEVWVYRRQISDHVDRVPVGSIPITQTIVGADGKAHQETVGETVQYADVHNITEEIVEVLMFNDHYVTLKVTRHDVKHYT